MRVNFLTIDAAGRTGADNPLTKQKVRQADHHGDRPAPRWQSSSSRAIPR